MINPIVIISFIGGFLIGHIFVTYLFNYLDKKKIKDFIKKNEILSSNKMATIVEDDPVEELAKRLENEKNN